MNRWPTTTLFLQALGLVGATLVAVFVSTMVVILNLPPPPPDVYSVAEVAQAMKTGKGGQAIEGRPRPGVEGQSGRHRAGAGSGADVLRPAAHSAPPAAGDGRAGADGDLRL